MRTVAGTFPPDKHRPGNFPPRGTLPPLPPDPGLDALLADLRLGSTAKTIAVALVKRWARFKDHAWPSDRTIAAAIGKSVGHVQRCLRELEAAGYVRREKTADNRTGRLIRLVWRATEASAGARPGPAPARGEIPAPARDKQVVVVNRGIELENSDSDSRSRPEPIAEPVIEVEPSAVEPVESVMVEMITTPSPAPVELPPAVEALPRIDLATISRPASPSPLPLPTVQPRSVPPARIRSQVPATAPTATRRRGLGLSRSELAGLVARTGDPILAAELTRATSPPPPSEPAPQTLATATLLAKLPGRHDLTSVATERLCQDLADFKPATWSFCRKAVEGVVARSVPFSVLLDCFRQATGPTTRDRGRVFVVAWKREGRLVN